MCGIAGYFGQGDREILEKMNNSMTHRGPDDAGFFICSQANNPPSSAGVQSRSVSGGLLVGGRGGSVGLGHRRLAIIDLSPLGHQPMLSQDGNIVIVFNGEIYNFQTLRHELEQKSYSFRGGSDTEVILAAYVEYGTKCFEKLNGMFAIALYDKRRSCLILARDRVGKKPLYWSLADGTFLFGSELKALMAHPAFKKEIDPLSFNKYLAFDYVPTPHTIFKNVSKLEPGHFLVYENGQVKKEQFWDITFSSDQRGLELGRSGSEMEILKEMDKRLEKAVVSRLVSDVPLGVFLSGGLDSSAITYYAQKNSLRPMETFSIAFEEKSFDESSYARKVAKQLGTNHHEERLTAKDALGLIPRVAEFLDEPMADYSIIPTYILSKFTKKHVTVALGGDGGDELFFGYPTFQAERLFPFLKAGTPLLKTLEKLLPVSHAHFNARFKIHQLLQGMSVPERCRHHAWMGTFIGERLAVSVQRLGIFDDIDRYLDQVKNEPRWDQLVYLYMRTYLMDQVLVKVDRASMAASLEVRAPFLDYEFVDFVNSIHYTHKIHGLTTKYLLKELMKDKLSHDIVYRKKQGFGVPLSAWFTNELKSFVLATLAPERIRVHGLFDSDMVQKIVSEHMNKKADHRKKLWSLIVFQLWYEKWMI